MYAKWIQDEGRFGFSITDNGGVELSKEEYNSLLAGNSAGQLISRGSDGRPELTDSVMLPMTLEQIIEARRIAYAAESDPVKNEAEYDAMVAGMEPDYSAWLAKVSEIKARYPLPE
jgi:hypothetical protein